MPQSFSQISPEEQFQLLSAGTVHIFNKEELLEKFRQKRSLIVKAGFDPSRPDIHLGHSILINKLRQFQELGHKVVFVVGDFTACIGDPSGQNKTRPALSFEESQKNAKTYKEQSSKKNFETSRALAEDSRKVFSFFKRLDSKKTKIVYNSDWFNRLSLREFILNAASQCTLARQLERDDFKKRFKANQPIALHELFYPILQAYDSVELKADVEIGGTDQLFNLLLGRQLQESSGQSPQVILTLPLLEGLDVKKVSEDNLKEGGQKMSKSLDNAIGFNDSSRNMYGKVMSISDDLLVRWWNLFTEGQINLKELFKSKKVHPKDKKAELAWLLVCSFYGEEQADREQEDFKKERSEKALPENIPEYHLDPRLSPKELTELLVDSGLCRSKSEARRKILEGAVRILKEETKLEEETKKVRRDQMEQIKDSSHKIIIHPKREVVLGVGKRNFRKINTKWDWIHDLKAYHVYRRIKEKKGERENEITQLSEDHNFKNYISRASIVMKLGNYQYLDEGRGLYSFSKQSAEVYEKYKNKSIEDIKKDIDLKLRKNKMESL